MLNFNFNSENDKTDFLNLFFRYIYEFGDVQRIKTKIGIKTATQLHGFLTSFTENNEEGIAAFASEYFGRRDSI